MSTIICLAISFGYAQETGTEILEKSPKADISVENGRAILERAQKACIAVENGRYTLRHQQKYFSRNDTNLNHFKVSFKRDTALEYGMVARMCSPSIRIALKIVLAFRSINPCI